MMCDSCANNRYCEFEERQMCIAHDYERFEECPPITEEDEEDEIEDLQNIFNMCFLLSLSSGSNLLFSALSAVRCLINKDVSDMMFFDILKSLGGRDA